MADEFFSMEIPDIESYIKDLNLLNENINKAVREGMHEGAEQIVARQRELAPYNLSDYIYAGKIYVTKKGSVGVVCGYICLDENEMLSEKYGISPYVLGRIFEFGRPGNSSTFRKDKYRYYHRYSKKRAAQNGGNGLEVFKGLKGVIQPHSHIIRGFDEVVEQAVQTVIKHINAEIDKMGEN